MEFIFLFFENGFGYLIFWFIKILVSSLLDDIFIVFVYWGLFFYCFWDICDKYYGIEFLLVYGMRRDVGLSFFMILVDFKLLVRRE